MEFSLLPYVCIHCLFIRNRHDEDTASGSFDCSHAAADVRLATKQGSAVAKDPMRQYPVSLAVATFPLLSPAKLVLDLATPDGCKQG